MPRPFGLVEFPSTISPTLSPAEIFSAFFGHRLNGS